MTATLRSTEDRHASRKVVSRRGWQVVAPYAGLVVGAALVSYAYADAARSGRPVHFHLFWLGEFCFFVPVLIRLLGQYASEGETSALLVAAGIFTSLPKFLRDPSGPLYFDELAHWEQTERIYHTHRLFEANALVPMAQDFPGLHALTVSVRYLTGLSTFQAAEVLLISTHIVALLGIYALAQNCNLSRRGAAMASGLYAVNPQFQYFDAQYAYESLGIVFVIWALVMATGILSHRAERTTRTGYFTLAVALIAACVMTHHASSYALAMLLILLAIRSCFDRRTDGQATVLVIGAATLSLVLAVGWAVTVAPRVAGYLLPYVLAAGEQTGALLGQHQPARPLFVGSQIPSYEHIAAMVTPVLLGVAVLISWRLSKRTAAAAALSTFGLLYFVTGPLMLAGPAVGDAIRRTWSFSYIGLAVLLGGGLAIWLGRTARQRFLVAGLVASFCVVLVGNVAMSVDAEYRFPGPYVYGSDTRSQGAELMGLVRWTRVHVGTNRHVIADRETALALDAYGPEISPTASPGLPIWQLYFRASSPDSNLLEKLRADRDEYLVVDRRMARYVPRIGERFIGENPAAFAYRRPPREALARYQDVPWATTLYASKHFRLYKLNFAVWLGSK